MEKIESFKIDHDKLKKGVYVSRLDHFKTLTLTTFDLRMKLPNLEELPIKGMHTIEHLMATFLRNNETYTDKIVYFGPMGCLTGMYLIIEGEFSSKSILPLVIQGFEFIRDYDDIIPGATAVECGNYRLHSLSEAKKEATIYLETLYHVSQENLVYPEIKESL